MDFNVYINPDTETKATLARIEAMLTRMAHSLYVIHTNQEKIMAVQDDITAGVTNVESGLTTLSTNLNALVAEAGSLHQMLLDALNANNMNGLADAAQRLGVLTSTLATMNSAVAQAVADDAPPAPVGDPAPAPVNDPSIVPPADPANDPSAAAPAPAEAATDVAADPTAAPV